MIQDPWGQLGYTIPGPGRIDLRRCGLFLTELGNRLSFYVISPWTRVGIVLIEHADTPTR